VIVPPPLRIPREAEWKLLAGLGGERRYGVRNDIFAVGEHRYCVVGNMFVAVWGMSLRCGGPCRCVENVIAVWGFLLVDMRRIPHVTDVISLDDDVRLSRAAGRDSMLSIIVTFMR